MLKLSLAIALAGMTVVACSVDSKNNLDKKTEDIVVVKQPQGECKSVHKNENLLPNISTNSITFKVPVSLSHNLKKGLSVVFLTTNNSTINVTWGAFNQEKEWKMADKHTVIKVRDREIDLSPMHRLNPNVYGKVVFFIRIPDVMWQKETIKIVPVVKKPDFRWGKVQKYNIRITAQGIQHPFRRIETASPNRQLSPQMTKILNNIEPGSIFIPKRYQNENLIEEPFSMLEEICPRTKAK